MLQLSSNLLDRQVLSLRTGSAVALATIPIINPNNLKIEGFYCEDEKRHTLVLLYQDIREVIPQGFIIDDLDVLTEPGELVRLKHIMDIDFQILGKQVVTASREKVGKVIDFATETTTMYIQKLYVSQSIFKNLSAGNLGIDRSQIVEITSSKIIINDLHGRVPARASAMA